MSELNFKKNGASWVLVSSEFIQKLMPKANASFVKVYLYGLMCYTQPLKNITNKSIAEALDMLESDVINAWKYWEKAGVLKINNTPEKFEIEFSESIEAPIEKVFKRQDSKPTYHPKELDIYINNNSEISHLFKVAQEKLGKPLSPSDSNTLYSFYDWLRLPVEVIIMLLEYCVSNNKLNIRYIEKVAIDWAEKGINNTDKAEEHLKLLEQKNSNVNVIKNALGISSILTEIQLEYINKWLYDYKFDIELIKFACEKTLLNTGKPSIKYVNSILEDWSSKKIVTKEQAINEIEKYNKRYKEKSFSKQNTDIKQQKNNKFLNFSQDKPDFDNFMKLTREKRINDLKESRSS
jgi:DnaD/phage-associated family protein